MMTLVAYLAHLMHNHTVLKTKSTGFSSPEDSRRMNRRQLAVFFRPHVIAPMGGSGGGTLGCAGFLERRSANPAICRPPRLAAGSGLTVLGGHDMAALPIPARSAHTFPQTEKAARRAVRRWFAGTPYLSLAEWRDQARLVHCARLPADPAREAAFDRAFAQELASIISGGVSHA